MRPMLKLQIGIMLTGAISAASAAAKAAPGINALASINPLANIKWESSFQDAFAKATAANKPVFIAINMDREPANDDLANVIYHSAKLVKKSADAVCLVASANRHDQVRAEDGSMVCARFGSIRCEDHIAIERAVRTTFLTHQRDIAAPQHILASPNREPIIIREWAISEPELLQLLATAVAVTANPAKAKKLEEKRVSEILGNTTSGSQEKRDAAVQALADTLCGWSRDVVLPMVRARVSTAVKVRIVQRLSSAGPAAEPALLDLLEDPAVTVRRQVVQSLATTSTQSARERLSQRLKIEKDGGVKQAIAAALDK